MGAKKRTLREVGGNLKEQLRRWAFSEVQRLNVDVLTSHSTIRSLRLPPLSLLVNDFQYLALSERDFIGIISGTSVCSDAGQ